MGNNNGLKSLFNFFGKFNLNASGQGWKFLIPPFQTTWGGFPSGHFRVTTLQGIT
jgi:hypothetical protein